MAKVATTALPAGVIVAPMPADANTLSLFPRGNAVADLINDAHDFVPGNAWILNSGPQAFLREHIAVTHATGLNFNAHFACARLGNLTLHDLKGGAGFGNLCDLHCRWFGFWRDSQRCHMSSF
jgi:hypothetical protein